MKPVKAPKGDRKHGNKERLQKSTQEPHKKPQKDVQKSE